MHRPLPDRSRSVDEHIYDSTLSSAQKFESLLEIPTYKGEDLNDHGN